MPTRPRPAPPLLPPLVAAAALVVWAAVGQATVGGDAAGTAGTVGLTAAAILLGTVLQPWRTAVGPVVASGVVVTFLATPDAFSGRPLAGPLDYANANAAWLVQAAAAAGLLAAVRRTWVRVLGGLATAGVVALVTVTGSAAGLATGLVVLCGVVVAAAGRAPRRRLLGLALAALFVLPVLGAVAAADHGAVPDRARTALSERRLDLWSDAETLIGDHPLAGVGPDLFPEHSPTALADPDTRPAHAALLELGAETGLVGLLLGASAIGLVMTMLRRSAAASPASALVGSVAWVALWAHAAVDYVADFPLVMVTAGLVAGLSGHAPYAEVRRSDHAGRIGDTRQSVVTETRERG